MSDKRRQQYSHGGGHHKRRQRPHNKHLYLVLDDWAEGYSIHRIDADSFHSDDDDGDSSAARPGHLPEPPALRLEPPCQPRPLP